MPYFLHNKIANHILSEALSYSLYLTIIGFFIEALYTKNNKPLMFSLIFMFIVLLTRTQFLFLVAIGIFIAIKNTNRKNLSQSDVAIIVLMAILPIASKLTDKIYHKLQHERFVSTPWKGIHLISPAFFVSQPLDVELFNKTDEKTLFQKVHKELTDKKLNLNSIRTENGKIGSIEIYVENHTEIANHTIFPAAMKIAPKEFDRKNKIIYVEKLTTSMLIPLVYNNLKEWVKLNARNFIQGFRDDKILIILIIIFVASLVKVIKPNSKPIFTLFLILSFSAIFNMAIVAIGIYTTPRYTFYNFWVLPMLFIVLFDFFIKNQNKMNNKNL